MPDIHTIKVILTVVSGLCWTIVYIEGIRLGFKDRSYAIPFVALALNIAWELQNTIFGFREGGGLQATINGVWFLFDLGIIYTYFKFGRKYFPQRLPGSWFVTWSLIVLVTAFGVEYAFTREFGVFQGWCIRGFPAEPSDVDLVY